MIDQATKELLRNAVQGASSTVSQEKQIVELQQIIQFLVNEFNHLAFSFQAFVGVLLDKKTLSVEDINTKYNEIIKKHNEEVEQRLKTMKEEETNEEQTTVNVVDSAAEEQAAKELEQLRQQYLQEQIEGEDTE